MKLKRLKARRGDFLKKSSLYMYRVFLERFIRYPFFSCCVALVLCIKPLSYSSFICFSFTFCNPPVLPTFSYTFASKKQQTVLKGVNDHNAGRTSLVFVFLVFVFIFNLSIRKVNSRVNFFSFIELFDYLILVNTSLK